MDSNPTICEENWQVIQIESRDLKRNKVIYIYGGGEGLVKRSVDWYISIWFQIVWCFYPSEITLIDDCTNFLVLLAN